jgi:hypothetical protein
VTGHGRVLIEPRPVLSRLYTGMRRDVVPFCPVCPEALPRKAKNLPNGSVLGSRGKRYLSELGPHASDIGQDVLSKRAYIREKNAKIAETQVELPRCIEQTAKFT